MYRLELSKDCYFLKCFFVNKVQGSSASFRFGECHRCPVSPLSQIRPCGPEDSSTHQVLLLLPIELSINIMMFFLRIKIRNQNGETGRVVCEGRLIVAWMWKQKCLLTQFSLEPKPILLLNYSLSFNTFVTSGTHCVCTQPQISRHGDDL